MASQSFLILFPELPNSDSPHHVPQRLKLFLRDMVISRDLLSCDAMMFLETIASIHQVSTCFFLFAVRDKNTNWGKLGERLVNYSTCLENLTMKIR